jgi:hypothetical protein
MLRVLTLCCMAVIAGPATAHAEWYLVPMAGLTLHGNTTLLDLEGGSADTHLQIGGAAALVSNGLFGVEAVTVFTPSFFRHDDRNLLQYGRALALMGNVILTVPKQATDSRPFVSGGFGLLRSSQSGLLPLTSNLSGFNIGVGTVGFLSPRTGLRFDLRYYSTLHRTQEPLAIGPAHLSYLTASVGIVFRR